jgi:hypothetical protein
LAKHDRAQLARVLFDQHERLARTGTSKLPSCSIFEDALGEVTDILLGMPGHFRIAFSLATKVRSAIARSADGACLHH